MRKGEVAVLITSFLQAGYLGGLNPLPKSSLTLFELGKIFLLLASFRSKDQKSSLLLHIGFCPIPCQLLLTPPAPV